MLLQRTLGIAHLVPTDGPGAILSSPALMATHGAPPAPKALRSGEGRDGAGIGGDEDTSESKRSGTRRLPRASNSP